MTRICLKRDTDENFKKKNEILMEGEIAFIKDDYNNIKSMKVGNGTDSYTDLETFASRDEIQELKHKIIELKVSIDVILGLIALGAGYFAFLTITIFN